MVALSNPQVVLFAQHGWADTHRSIARLAHSLVGPEALVIAPDLGYLNTWLRIEPLIQQVEQVASQTIAQYPDTPIRIIGHSMGGLIWLEALHRHPEWWPQVAALTLVASPIGGADLARIIDPLGWGIGIAKDLGQNRRPIAEAIAAQIPTLIIAGDFDRGSDGTVPVTATQVAGTQHIILPGLAHATLKDHPAVGAAIQQFWQQPSCQRLSDEPAQAIIRYLQAVPGMTDTHPRDFARSRPSIQFPNGLTVHTWSHPLGAELVFLANSSGQCLYSGFVGWPDRSHLHQALQKLGNVDLTVGSLCLDYNLPE